jgi:phage tail-like protein
MAVGDRVDQASNFNFRVEIQGLTVGAFRECSGLGSSIEVIENPAGGMGHVAKQPGRIRYPNLVLKAGITSDSTLYTWHRQALEGNVRRLNGSVVQLDAGGRNEVARWNFTDGWPSKWDGPTYNAGANEIAVESMEIAHEGLVRA